MLERALTYGSCLTTLLNMRLLLVFCRSGDLMSMEKSLLTALSELRNRLISLKGKLGGDDVVDLCHFSDIFGAATDPNLNIELPPIVLFLKNECEEKETGMLLL